MYIDNPTVIPATSPLSILNSGIYADGAPYSLTNSLALVNMGNPPSIFLPATGTYRLTAQANVIYTGATFAANQMMNLRLRCINNATGDLSASSFDTTLGIVTTLTAPIGMFPLPPVNYTTTGIGDNIQVYGSLTAAPSLGAVNVTAANISYIKLT